MFAELLEGIALALEARDIPYMLIGSQALLLHGEPRLTRDVDVALGAGLDALPLVLEAAGEMLFELLADPETFTRRTMVLPCRELTSRIRVDFIFSHLPYESEAIARAIRVPIRRARVRFASAEDLVIHKVIAGRPRDLEDARSVLVKNPGLDREFVRRTLAWFSAALGQLLVERFDEMARDSAQ